MHTATRHARTGRHTFPAPPIETVPPCPLCRTPLPEGRPLDPLGNGPWIYLFKPRSELNTVKVGNEAVQVGKLEVEKLVDLSRHEYRLEPNVTFTPDGKWIVFRSNMHGSTHVYAVEVAKPQ